MLHQNSVKNVTQKQTGYGLTSLIQKQNAAGKSARNKSNKSAQKNPFAVVQQNIAPEDTNRTEIYQ